MTEPVFWIGIDFSDHIPTGDEMQSIADSLGEGLDGDAIVTTREVEPMNQEKRENYVRELTAALEE
jgi:hypothetical protein